MRFNHSTLMTSGTMNADIYTDPIDMNQMFVVAVQCSWTGNPVGNLMLEASNDGTVWSNITPSLTAINGPGDIIFNVVDVGYQWLRVAYQYVNRTGILTVTVNKKGF